MNDVFPNDAMASALECADLAALSAGNLSPSHTRGTFNSPAEPLNAALLWRRVAKAEKAATSRRTPK
jgi:hypothetical protein